jgi:hypothetical protein
MHIWFTTWPTGRLVTKEYLSSFHIHMSISIYQEKGYRYLAPKRRLPPGSSLHPGLGERYASYLLQEGPAWKLTTSLWLAPGSTEAWALGGPEGLSGGKRRRPREAFYF